MAEVRLRFAPSPTGQVHIGNIRAAIFNWLQARHAGGKFLLRVEDTDRERSTPEAIASLLDVMAWLGLDCDEEPLYQSRRLAAHQAAANRLVAAGLAYRSRKGEGGGEAVVFRIPWAAPARPFVRRAGAVELRADPAVPVRIGHWGVSFGALTDKGKTAKQEACLAGFRELRLLDAAGQCRFELEPRSAEVLAGAELEITDVATLRFVRHEVWFTDLVKGELAKPLDSMKDLVILRSDGTPVFHLANVCDDIHQRITHIVRGDDHVENTYRHLFLFDALAAPAPLYAHLPMIVNAAGKPYSKRDGDAFVGEFREKGFLAAALFNYLMLLGWSPGDNREKLTRAEAVARFDLARVKSAAAQMDGDKLLNLNGQYLAELPLDDFLRDVRRVVAGQPWYEAADPAYFRRVAQFLQSRTKLFNQALTWAYLFTEDYPVDADLVRKNLKPELKPAFAAVLANLRALPVFTTAGIEAAVHQATDGAGIKRGKLNQPLRVAVTGTTIGAGLYETMELLGKDRVEGRLARTIAGFEPGA